jgi:hypothetical protein
MVEPIPIKSVDTFARRAATGLGAVAGILGLIVSIAQRSPSIPTMSGIGAVNVVLHLTLLCAIAYGILWGTADKWIFKWNYGAGGGESLPSGWSAVVLSLSVTLPLALVPFLYQRITGIQVALLPTHWEAMLVVVVTGAVGHLVMYGAKSNGVLQRFAPMGEYRSFDSGLLLEAIYSIVLFGCIVLPYRFVLNSHAQMRDLLLIRLLIPCLAYLFGMMFFITFKYSPDDRKGIELRGIFAGVLLMSCLCAAMFL